MASIPGLEFGSPDDEEFENVNLFHPEHPFRIPKTFKIGNLPCIQDYRKEEEIPSPSWKIGSYRSVDKSMVLLKESKNKKPQHEDLKWFVQTTQLLRKIENTNILKFLGVTMTIDMKIMYLIFENATCFLSTIIEMKTGILYEESTIRGIMFQILEGLQYMHYYKLVHRNLSTNAIMFTCDGIVKIADFEHIRSVVTTNAPADITFYGYQSPEAILSHLDSEDKSSTSSDIWSAGCIFAELLLKKPLFFEKTTESYMAIFVNIVRILGVPTQSIWPQLNEFKRFKLMQFNNPHYYNCLAEVFLSEYRPLGPSLKVLKGMLLYDPIRRKSAEDCLESSFFKEADANENNVALLLRSYSVNSKQSPSIESAFHSINVSDDEM